MAHEKRHDYHIIDPSLWPFLGALSAFIMLAGAVLMFHDVTPWLAVLGLIMVLYTMYAWWADVIGEAQAGDHTPVVRIGLRMGFILFIMSDMRSSRWTSTVWLPGPLQPGTRRMASGRRRASPPSMPGTCR
jgi:cytochrome c oxidase subunit 3